MAPLIVFAAIVGVAISKLPSASRRVLIDFFKASAANCLRTSPISIFRALIGLRGVPSIV
jgi:Na+/H+-dicarboxylate symporter